MIGSTYSKISCLISEAVDILICLIEEKIEDEMRVKRERLTGEGTQP